MITAAPTDAAPVLSDRRNEFDVRSAYCTIVFTAESLPSLLIAISIATA